MAGSIPDGGIGIKKQVFVVIVPTTGKKGRGKDEKKNVDSERPIHGRNDWIKRTLICFIIINHVL